MNRAHDPIRQAQYLRQCLVQDKRPLGIFLGAGCPASILVGTNGAQECLIPDIAGLTKCITENMTSSSLKENFSHLCGQLKDDFSGDSNIEQILSHIRSMRQVAGRGKVHGLTSLDLDALDTEICGHIVTRVNKSLPTFNTSFNRIAGWIAAIQRSHPVEIFTTNYDLLMEEAMEEAGVPYFDGFVGSRRSFFDLHAMEEDLLPPRWSRLWKLHGSINWWQDSKGLVFRAENDGKHERRVIHPSHLKYDESRRMPYLAMIDRLKAFLKKPSAVLVVCGYSFRDDHLNEVVSQGLHGNPTAVTFGLLFDFLERYEKAMRLAGGRPNLSLLARDEAFIALKKAPWCGRSGSETIAEAIAVERVEESIETEEGIMRYHFKLGDFLTFGEFLSDVIGSETVTGKESHAQ